jgi:SAM-dependent methyltransferase
VLLFLVCLRDRQGSRLRGWMCGAVGLMAAALCVLLVECGRKETRGAVNLTRNFYGVLSVWEYCRDDLQGHYRVLQHGQISHGLQYTDPYRALLPTAYFTKRSGVGLALESLSNRSNRVVGVVGLGVGTLAAYGKKGDQFRFYEINPAVEHLARHQFRYLEDSSAEVKVILGDARLVLEREPSQQFDLLALDAFSSDAIPVHLLTREAFAVYLRHLKPDGVLAVHTSNRHINLAPVLANVAAEFRLHSTTVEGPVSSMELYDDDGECDWAEYESTWVLLSSSIISFDRASAQKTTGEAAPSPAIPLWTDDYTSVFPLVR